MEAHISLLYTKYQALSINRWLRIHVCYHEMEKIRYMRVWTTIYDKIKHPQQRYYTIENSWRGL